MPTAIITPPTLIHTCHVLCCAVLCLQLLWIFFLVLSGVHDYDHFESNVSESVKCSE
jgi:hypothetical protein